MGTTKEELFFSRPTSEDGGGKMGQDSPKQLRSSFSSSDQTVHSRSQWSTQLVLLVFLVSAPSTNQFVPVLPPLP